MNEHLTNGKLYFKVPDGKYHELGEIQGIKESIIKADDEARANAAYTVPSNSYSLKQLSESGYFDREVNFDLIINGDNENLLKLLNGIEEQYILMMRYNLALIDSYWVVEFAKRYILEHYKEANNE